MTRTTRSAHEADERGFTLIELLVVIVIIGVLATVAIPTFLNQRNKGYDAQAKTDARNMQIAAETAFTDVQKYPAALTAGADYKTSPTPSGHSYASQNIEVDYCISVVSRSGRTWYAANDVAGVTTTSC